MTPEGCSDAVDSNADSDPAVDDSEASSSDGGEEAMDRLRQVVNLLENCAPNHLHLEYDTMQAKRQAIMSSNLLWSAEEKADYGQWPLILGSKTDKILPHRSSSYPSLAKPTGTGARMDSLQIRTLPRRNRNISRCSIDLFPSASGGSPDIVPGHWVLVEARLSDHTFRFHDSLRRSKESVDDPNISSPEQNFANCLKNIVPFLTARAEGPIPGVTGGSDRPKIPYAEWEGVVVKPRVPKKGDLMPRTEFTRQPDGNACGVFVCRTMETLVAAVAFQSELDWSWSPLKPLQDNFYANQRAYMLDGSGAPPPVLESVPLALKESSPELEEKPLGSGAPGIEFCAPTPVLIDPSAGTIYTSEPNPDAQCTSPLISRSPRPNPAPSIATIGSMPDAPPMRLPRVVRFDPTPPLPVSEALEVVACLPRYQTRTLAVRPRYIQKRPKPSPIEAQEGRIFFQSCAASLKPCTQCLARNTNLMLESIAQGMGSPKLHRTLPCHQNTHIGHGSF
ncbi:BQ5605_C029g10599 [Microbotryum silenes-dioicae]|uniref:BQ5605_C029g10599 protein n=1 Tax=Microbotryum silenes-dioicae TaxID=796604 RepID=A0A2X0PJ19_9BASI|nr:BQ5605_C029g10599 [Microbotryum silenes-dioicae]